MRSTINLLILVLLICNTSVAQSLSAKKIDELVAPLGTNGQFAGVVLVSENGKIIYEKAFGFANAEFKIANTTSTRIGVASITKPMTSVILSRLIEEKKVALADLLNKYIPDFPNGEKITIEMLARHRSGIPHRVMPPEYETVPYTSEQMIEKIKQAKLEFEPGARNLYSSAGFTVLTRVLEIASGKPYAQLLQEYVFGPAGMKDTFDFDGPSIIERRAQDYFLDANGYTNAALKDYSFLIGAGSVYSTAADQHRFVMAVLDGKYGETVKTNFVRDGKVSFSGRTNGHRAYLEYDAANKNGMVIISNLASGGFDFIQFGLSELLSGKDLSVARLVVPKIDTEANKDLRQFLGKYRNQSGGQIEIELKNGSLYSSDIKLHSIKPDCFFDYRFFGEACFLRKANGDISEIKWKGLTFELSWQRQ